MAAIGLAPCSPVAVENIRDLQRWTGQGRTGLLDRFRLSLGGRAGSVRRSSGLSTVRRMFVATCV